MKFYSTIEDVDRLFRCYNVDMNKWHLKNQHIPPYSIFFSYIKTSPVLLESKWKNLGEVAFFGSHIPGRSPHLWWLGKSLSFPNFQSLTISQLLMGPKPQHFWRFFFFFLGGGGFTGKLQTGNLIFWSGFFFLLSKCCSLDFFLTHWFESMAITVMIIHFLTVPLKMSDLKGILGSYVLSHLFIASFFRRHSRSLM